MNTVYDRAAAWKDGKLAAGFGGGLDGTRRRDAAEDRPRRARPVGRDNVIDLAAWREASLSAPGEEPDWTGEEMAQPEIPASRPRRSQRAALIAELVSTACVALVTLVIILRVLTF